MQAKDTYPLFLWALAVWREARGESYNTRLGVAWVIRNRMLDKAGRWPRTMDGVILQPRQFSAFNVGDPNATKFPPSADASWDACCEAVGDCLKGIPTDPTGGANHYHSLDAAQASTWPAWAEVNRQTAIFGRTRFYKL